ncbi:hypothetical protein [Alkalihalobacillus sp. TS-13]|uniref:hypothetical protein n=1 Tax=Alkalihalobacillus sp. TS-13 TaxID=2842455 RepID=UPI001C874A44|nr:hypothetical protein [Alkalihalobacillus sp. TS-13]
MKKRLNIVFTIIYVPLIIGAIQMFFDENPFNDHIGSLFLIVLMMFQGIHIMIRDLLDGKKKTLFFNVVFIATAGGLLAWTIYHNLSSI